MLKTRLLSLLLTLITCLPAFAADKQRVVYHLSYARIWCISGD